MIGSPALGAGRSAAMRAQDATRATADTPAVVDRVPPRTTFVSAVSVQLQLTCQPVVPYSMPWLVR